MSHTPSHGTHDKNWKSRNHLQSYFLCCAEPRVNSPCRSAARGRLTCLQNVHLKQRHLQQNSLIGKCCSLSIASMRATGN